MNESFANGLTDFAFGHGDLPLIVGRSTGLRHRVLMSSGRGGDSPLRGRFRAWPLGCDNSPGDIGELRWLRRARRAVPLLSERAPLPVPANFSCGRAMRRAVAAQ